MNTLSEHDLDLHVKILGWLYLITHAMFLVIGALVLLLLFPIGMASGDPQAFTYMGLAGLFVAGLMTLLGLPGMLAGYGLLRKRSWGRILAIVVGVLGLFNFPVGTVISLYTLWVLMQDSAARVFSPAQA